MDNLTLRIAENKDFSSVYKLLTELGYTNISPDSYQETWNQILASDQTGILIAETERDIAGYLLYSLKPP
jgi:hypothetical protein